MKHVLILVVLVLGCPCFSAWEFHKNATSYFRVHMDVSRPEGSIFGGWIYTSSTNISPFGSVPELTGRGYHGQAVYINPAGDLGSEYFPYYSLSGCQYRSTLNAGQYIRNRWTFVILYRDNFRVVSLHRSIGGGVISSYTVCSQIHDIVSQSTSAIGCYYHHNTPPSPIYSYPFTGFIAMHYNFNFRVSSIERLFNIFTINDIPNAMYTTSKNLMYPFFETNKDESLSRATNVYSAQGPTLNMSVGLPVPRNRMLLNQ